MIDHDSYFREKIITKTIELGACSAGIARVEDLKASPSYGKYAQDPYYDFFEELPDWPDNARSILVFALEHPQIEPKLDWWDPKPGGTPGNRALIKIQKKMKKWLKEELGLSPRSLPYKLEEGGILLKDTSALAGIGIIGKNNILITPEHGPRVRLRGMFIDIDLDPTGPVGFDPCSACDMPCFKACPQDAFRSGTYQREYCQIEMRKNEADVKPHPDDPEIEHVRYCRACELSCPVGKSKGVSQ
jgi:epoxyqueuosine reductase